MHHGGLLMTCGGIEGLSQSERLFRPIRSTVDIGDEQNLIDLAVLSKCC